jgi:uncharacterized protein DUF4115
MSDHTNDSRPPVPDLIERYRLRRDAWIAQADELARLRDEVRGAAEREAMEIVTAARRDVRQVIMEARRELLVLSAQVQAALGEVSGKDPASLNRGSESLAALQPGAVIDASPNLLVPESAVKTMLDEARSDIEALAHDAKTVPFQATALAAQPKITVEAERVAPPPPPPLAPLVFESVPSLAPPSSTSPSNSPDESRVLLSPLPIDAVAVPADRSVRAFVGLFILAGVAIVGTSIWWLTGRGSSSEAVETKPAAATPAAAATTGAPPTKTPVAAAAPVVRAKETTTPSRLSLTVEARRQSWIRATVDGESDIGRMYAAGEKLQLNADQGISLRVGDAGAVYVSVNKGAPTALGPNGMVITRQFVADRASSSGTGSAPPNAPSAPVTAAPKPVPPSVPTASLTPGAAPSSLPVPIVQPTVAASAAQPFETAASSANRPETGAPVARVEPGPPAAAPAASPIVQQPPTSNAVVAAARQWLDAYQRQERSVMAALSTDSLQLADERRADERFPANADVSRSLDRVSVQIAADTAVLTAVMTERDSATQRVSPISQVWVLSGGQWRVRQVRLVSEARLNQIFR